MQTSLEFISETRKRLGDHILETPVWPWVSARKDSLLGLDTEVLIKMELLQHGSSFKLRGALIHMLNLTEDQLIRGVTAISAGNHAIAVAYAAKIVGTSAKVVMSKHANPLKLQKTRELGAEVVMVENNVVGFERVKDIEKEEERYFVHPFDSPMTTLGTATLGAEFYRQAKRLDAAIIPIGGGGLASGMAMGIKLSNPLCKVYGVEPRGANTMYLSFQSGKPEKIPSTNTIADSLAAPFTLPFSLKKCQEYLESVVLIDDNEMRNSMLLMFEDLKLAVEPACAASMSALIGPLKQELKGKRVGIIACGSNIDTKTWCELVSSQ